VQAAVKMADPRNRKLTQPFTILDLAGDQDNFLTFGVAGFCHDCLRLKQGVEKARQSFVRAMSRPSETGVTYKL
jgi:hypothetical protein